MGRSEVLDSKRAQQPNATCSNTQDAGSKYQNVNVGRPSHDRVPDCQQKTGEKKQSLLIKKKKGRLWLPNMTQAKTATKARFHLGV